MKLRQGGGYGKTLRKYETHTTLFLLAFILSITTNILYTHSLEVVFNSCILSSLRHLIRMS